MSRPKVLQLDITNDEDRALKDPALVAMVDAGWTVPYIWNKTVKDDGQPVQHYLMVFLMPPGQGHKALAEMLASHESLYRAQAETLDAERLALATTLTAHDTRAHNSSLQVAQEVSRLHRVLYVAVGAWAVTLLVIAAAAWWTVG